MLFAMAVVPITGGEAAPPPPSVLSQGTMEESVKLAYMAIARFSGAGTLPSQEDVVAEAYGQWQSLAMMRSMLPSRRPAVMASSSAFTYDAAGIAEVYFGIDWVEGSIGHTTYWADLRGHKLDGPTDQRMSALPLVRLPSRKPGPMVAQNAPNRAGWQYWENGSLALDGVQSDEIVRTFSVPPEAPQGVPAGYFADAWADTWMGVSAQDAGYGGMLQAGYGKDATNSNRANYELWYEFCACNDANSYPHSYPGTPKVVPGHYQWEQIQAQANNNWYVGQTDLTAGQGWSVT
ncbi:MAG: hypothetical protein LC624_02415, partial [Halobacteriales archaeon]|nr:hypothetical protein [Halobacteriales archaeon]